MMIIPTSSPWQTVLGMPPLNNNPIVFDQTRIMHYHPGAESPLTDDLSMPFPVCAERFDIISYYMYVVELQLRTFLLLHSFRNLIRLYIILYLERCGRFLKLNRCSSRRTVSGRFYRLTLIQLLLKM